MKKVEKIASAAAQQAPAAQRAEATLTPFAVEGSVGATVSVGFFCSRRRTLFVNFSGFRLL